MMVSTATQSNPIDTTPRLPRACEGGADAVGGGGLHPHVSESSKNSQQPAPPPTPKLTNHLLEDLLNPSISALDLCNYHDLSLNQLTDIINSEQFKAAKEMIETISDARRQLMQSEAETLAIARLTDLCKDRPETPAHAETVRKAASKLLAPPAKPKTTQPTPSTSAGRNQPKQRQQHTARPSAQHQGHSPHPEPSRNPNRHGRTATTQAQSTAPIPCPPSSASPSSEALQTTTRSVSSLAPTASKPVGSDQHTNFAFSRPRITDLRSSPWYSRPVSISHLWSYRHMRSNLYLPVSIATAAMLSASSLAAPIEWEVSDYGLWEDAFNWSPMRIPSFNDEAILAHATPYSVYMQDDHLLGGLTISNPLAGLDLLAGSVLEMRGSIHNEGLIRVNPKRSPLETQLLINANMSITGSGTIELNPWDDDEPVLFSSVSDTITHGPDHTLTGGGRVEVSMINQGRIVANLPQAPLVLDDVDLQNDGELTALAGTSLVIDRSEIDQGAGGVIQAVGPGAEVSVHGSQITGGVLRTGVGGVIRSTLGSSLIEMTFDEPLSLVLDTAFVLFDSSVVSTTLDLRGESALIFEDGSELVGTGVINLISENGVDPAVIFRPEAGIESAFQIRGAGSVQGEFTNRTTITADQPGEVLVVERLLNDGSLLAEMGGTLRFTRLCEQTKDGVVQSVGNASVVDLNDGFVGGRIQSVSGGGFISSTGSVWFQNTEFDGELEVSDHISFEEHVVNNGVVRGRLHTSLGVVIDGDGRFELVDANTSTGNNQSGTSMIQMPDHTLTGWGRISGPIENRGLISADEFDQTLLLDSGDLLNSGIIQAVGGATLRLEHTVIQSEDAIIRAAGPGSMVEFGGPGAGQEAVVRGGTLRSSTGGMFKLDDRLRFEHTHFDAMMTLDAFGFMEVGEGFVNDGVIEVDPQMIEFFGASVILDTSEPIEGDGVIRLMRSDGYTAISNGLGLLRAELGPGQRIEGLGIVRANLMMHGALSPGLPIGDMQMAAEIELGDSARVELEIAPDIHDRVLNSGTMTLAGALELAFVDGFEPEGYWVRQVIEAGSILGQFDSIQVPHTPPGLITRTYNTGTELLVGQTCVADFELDGDIDFFDVSLFITAFSNGLDNADLNDDGLLNFFDVSAFIVGYGAGCP